MKAPKTHCRNGHRLTEKTGKLRFYMTGRSYILCKVCRANQCKRAYANDPELRARKKAHTKAWQQRKKQVKQNECGLT